MNHPRIVFVDDSSNPGGAELSVSRYLSLSGDADSSVLLLSDGDVTGWGLPSATRVVRVRPRGSLVGQLRMVGEIDSHLKKLAPDCVVCNSHSAAKLLALVPKRGTPFVQFLRREAVNPSAPAWKQQVREHLILRRFDGFLANSAWTARTIPTGLRDSRPVELSYPISGTHPAAPMGGTRRGEPLRLLSLSRWAPWKGIHLVLDVVAELESHGLRDRVRLTLAGGPTPGEETYADSVWAKARQLSGMVDVVGHVDDVDGVLTQSDVLLCLSTEPEPFGQVVVQGMANGLQVIATDQGGPCEIITPRKNGVLVSPHDVVAAANSIRWALDEPDEARALRENAINEARRFSDGVTVPMFTGAVEAVLRGGRH